MKIDYAKGKIYLGGSIKSKQDIIERLGVSEGMLLIPFIGLPLISTAIKKIHCQPIVEKKKE